VGLEKKRIVGLFQFGVLICQTIEEDLQEFAKFYWAKLVFWQLLKRYAK
jgi:hypothetical protein